MNFSLHVKLKEDVSVRVLAIPLEELAWSAMWHDVKLLTFSLEFCLKVIEFVEKFCAKRFATASLSRISFNTKKELRQSMKHEPLSDNRTG